MLIVCVSMVTLHCVCNGSVFICPEVNAYRLDLEGITVKGKGCPKPIRTWVQCGVSMKILNALKKCVLLMVNRCVMEGVYFCLCAIKIKYVNNSYFIYKVRCSGSLFHMHTSGFIFETEL